VHSTYGSKPVDSILNRRCERMDILKSFGKSSVSPTVTLSSAEPENATGGKLSPKSDDPASDKPSPDEINRVHDVLTNSVSLT